MLLFKGLIAGDTLNYKAESRIPVCNHLPLNLSKKTIVSQQQSLISYKALTDPSKAVFLGFSPHINGR